MKRRFAANAAKHQRPIEGEWAVIVIRAGFKVALPLDKLAHQMLFEHDLPLSCALEFSLLRPTARETPRIAAH